MANKEKINIFPSRASLHLMKTRLASATLGHKLMRKKSEALYVHFREVMRTIVGEKARFMETLSEGHFLLTKARYACPFLKYTVLDDVNTAHVKVRTRLEYYSGVCINVFECYDDLGDDYKCVGLSRGGREVNEVKRHYKLLIRMAVRLASLKLKYTKLEQVIRLTNIRVNGIEHIIMPRLTNTIAYILSQLEENEREEFFRLKLIQQKKVKKEPERKSKMIVGSCAFLAGEPTRLFFDIDVWSSDEDFESLDE